MARNWWALLLRGLVAIGFAVVAWARPGPTLAILVVLFGAYAIADGVVALVGAVARGAPRRELVADWRSKASSASRSASSR